MKTSKTVFHRVLSSFLLGLALVACGAGPAASAPGTASNDVEKLFDYDPKAPLDLQIASSEKKEGYTLHELSYASPKGGRVPALLLVPEGTGPFPAVLVMHGAPGSARTILPEAEALAKLGAVALTISAPFSRGERLGNNREILRFDERDRADQIQLIIDMRRAIDLLLARPDVDKNRIAYDGRSYGAAQGALLAGIEKRIKAYALVVGDGGLVSHFTGADDTEGPLQTLPPEKAKAWREAMEPIEPIRWIGRAAPAHLLFQNGRTDTMVPEADGRALQEAASEPKKVLWYDGGHQLDEQANLDRYTWLAEQIGIRKPEPAVAPAQ